MMAVHGTLGPFGEIVKDYGAALLPGESADLLISEENGVVMVLPAVTNRAGNACTFRGDESRREIHERLQAFIGAAKQNA